MIATAAYVPTAVTTRNGMIESVHHAAGVAIRPDGSVAAFVGDPDVLIYPRSANKPLQALAMLAAGLEADSDALALACASHSGCIEHLAIVERVLAAAGLSTADLANTADLPLDLDASESLLRRGGTRSSLTQNCSGKHAAMLATCVASGWSTSGYLGFEHPLQVHITEVLADVLGTPVAHVGIDGCGAPAHMMTLHDLARSFAGFGRGDTPGHRAVAAAMSGRPDLVGGPGRAVTQLMSGIPGLVAKDGAEGVFAAALPDGSAAAVKIADGAGRAAPVVLAALLAALGADVAAAEVAWRPVILGHGNPVGDVQLIGPLAEVLSR